MGEYAQLRSTGERVKIGTCESMMYLRYEDRAKVAYDFGGHEWFWRLPLPAEDDILPGHYESSEPGVKLYIAHASGSGTEDDPLSYRYDYFHDESTTDDPGSMQLRHPSGLLVNVPCYHGEQLPEMGSGRAFWNGKDPASYELIALKNKPQGIRPVVRCRWCRRMWSYEWAEVLPYIPDEKLRERLSAYAD